MSGTLDELQARVDALSRRATLSCLPLFAGLGLLLAEMYLGFDALAPGVTFGLVILGFGLATIPMIRCQRAKNTLEREKKRAQLAELASFMDADR